MKSDADARALGLLVQVRGGATEQRQTLGRFELPAAAAAQHLQLLRCQHEADSVTHSINIPRESLELLWLEPLDAAIDGALLACAEFYLFESFNENTLGVGHASIAVEEDTSNFYD